MKSTVYSLNISRGKIFTVLGVISENFSLEIFRPPYMYLQIRESFIVATLLNLGIFRVLWAFEVVHFKNIVNCPLSISNYLCK